MALRDRQAFETGPVGAISPDEGRRAGLILTSCAIRVGGLDDLKEVLDMVGIPTMVAGDFDAQVGAVVP